MVAPRFDSLRNTVQHPQLPLWSCPRGNIPSPPLPMCADQIQPMRKARRQYAARALELNGGNLTATAKMLGVAVNALRSYLGRS